jgi:hypothetical protein
MTDDQISKFAETITEAVFKRGQPTDPHNWASLKRSCEQAVRGGYRIEVTMHMICKTFSPIVYFFNGRVIKSSVDVFLETCEANGWKVERKDYSFIVN